MNICKICFESNNLISPCKCNGSIKYIHSNCLEKWRTMNIDNDNYIRCPECLYYYSYILVDFTPFQKIINKIVTFICNNLKSNNIFTKIFIGTPNLFHF